MSILSHQDCKDWTHEKTAAASALLKRTAFFDTKPHDKGSFERQNNRRYDIRYFETRQNKTLSLFVSLPNIITNSHRAFLTHEALANIVAPTAAAIN